MTSPLPCPPPAPHSFAPRYTPDPDQLRYLEAGSGAPVVLIHGAITTAEDMAIALFDTLAPSYRTIAFDRPGFGESKRNRFGGDLLAQAMRLREGVRALGLERPVIVGHSFGGAVALTYAQEWPDEVGGLLLISPLVLPEPRLEHLLFGPRFLAGFGDFIAFGPGRVQDAIMLPLMWEMMFKPQSMPKAFRDAFPFELAGRAGSMQAMGEDAMQAMRQLTKNLARLSKLTAPTRILAGSADLVIDPWKHGGTVAVSVPGARMKILPGVGHMVHHVHPEAVAEAIHELYGASSASRPVQVAA